MLAQAWGYGGITAVSVATGVARSTIGRGLEELERLAGGAAAGSHLRRPGGGRKKAAKTDPTLLEDLQRLVDPVTRGDPESPLLWVSKSTRHLAEALRQQGHRVSHETVRQLLKELRFTLQANRKTREGSQHPDRNAQFEHLAAQVKKFLAADQPVISVDTKKKELVGDFRNGGQEWERQGDPVEVRTHDFPDPVLGKAIPYGVYDLGAEEGWVSVGIDHDTAEFAVETIRRWWLEMGRTRYPAARHLLVTADGGGSNSSRGKLWKTALQGLADELGLRIWVCHFPPGTSKWNKIEHRMFSRITQNWRGRPLHSIEVIVNLIANTRLSKGVPLRAAHDPGKYPKGKQVPQEELDTVRLLRQEFHGEWNYVILPKADWPDWNEAVNT
jgi:transposase